MKYFLLTLITAISLKVQSQSEYEKFVEGVETFTWFMDHPDYKWEFSEHDSTILINFIGKFEFQPFVGTTNLDNRIVKEIDTLTITLRAFPFKSDYEIEQIRIKNSKIIDSLTPILIEYFENTGWPYGISDSQIEDDPVGYLKSSKLFEDSILREIVRIPDMRIRDFIVYIDLSIDVRNIFIYPNEAEQMIMDFIVNIFTFNNQFRYGIDNVSNNKRNKVII